MRTVRFVLVRPRDPNNIGAAARAMANFGFGELVVVDPYPPTWREAKSAVGAGAVMAAARCLSLDEALSGAELVLGACGGGRKFRRPVVELPALGDYLAARLGAGRLVVLFGSEKTGLTGAQLGRCHALLRIPTSPRTPSMNLGHAVAVAAYELVRPRRAAVLEPPLPPAPTEQLEVLVAQFLRAFAALGYGRGLPRPTMERRVRETLQRLGPRRKDAGLLLALLRRVNAGKSG
ncbi:MAG: RNA methyltransferase [Elusimicrobia bacterium]|nr:RNA methyltransferase [Elusimicrobiota bacterium]